VAACAGYAATRSEDLVDQLRIIDRRDRRRWSAKDHPSGDGPPVRYGQAILDDIASCGLRPTVPKPATDVVTPAPDAT